MHRRMASEPGFWDKRPLSEDELEYACTDVLLLHKLIKNLEDLMVESGGSDEWKRYSEAYTTIVRYADDPNEVVMHEGIPLYGIADYDKVSLYLFNLFLSYFILILFVIYLNRM